MRTNGKPTPECKLLLAQRMIFQRLAGERGQDFSNKVNQLSMTYVSKRREEPRVTYENRISWPKLGIKTRASVSSILMLCIWVAFPDDNKSLLWASLEEHGFLLTFPLTANLLREPYGPVTEDRAKTVLKAKQEEAEGCFSQVSNLRSSWPPSGLDLQGKASSLGFFIKRMHTLAESQE